MTDQDGIGSSCCEPPFCFKHIGDGWAVLTNKRNLSGAQSITEALCGEQSCSHRPAEQYVWKQAEAAWSECDIWG